VTDFRLIWDSQPPMWSAPTQWLHSAKFVCFRVRRTPTKHPGSENPSWFLCSSLELLLYLLQPVYFSVAFVPVMRLVFVAALEVAYNILSLASSVLLSRAVHNLLVDNVLVAFLLFPGDGSCIWLARFCPQFFDIDEVKSYFILLLTKCKTINLTWWHHVHLFLGRTGQNSHII